MTTTLDTISAGYLILRPTPRLSHHDEALLPTELVSASSCVCPQFPHDSTLSWVQTTDVKRAAALDAVGLAPDRRHEAIEWATSQVMTTFGFPNVFFTVAAALAARRRFFGDRSPNRVIGLGLPREHVARFLASADADRVAPGGQRTADMGFEQCVKRQQTLEPRGTLLGFELLVVESGGFVNHSWLCNGLESHCATALGIKPGSNGLIDDLESANRCCDEIARPEVGAEPGLWLPWALVEYDS